MPATAASPATTASALRPRGTLVVDAVVPVSVGFTPASCADAATGSVTFTAASDSVAA